MQSQTAVDLDSVSSKEHVLNIPNDIYCEEQM